MAVSARQQQQQMMRQAARARQITSPQMLAAPVKGWNTRDPYEAMDPQDAVVLDNWQPDFGGVSLREGSQTYRQLGLEPSAVNPDELGPVTSLAVWRAGGREQLLAAQGGSIAEVDSGQILGSGFGAGWWQTALFESRLFLVNGADPPQSYDGTTLAAAGFVPAVGSAYPLDPNNLIGVAVIHNRLFFWTGQDCGVWYADLLAITGELNYYPFSSNVEDGAFVVNVLPLTYDGGLGIATYTVFVLSTGTILIYAGTDPSVPATSQYPDAFNLTGIYPIPAPLGVRAVTRYGGDAYIVTSSDYQKLSQFIMALRMGVQPPRSKATGACIAAVAAGRGLPGWQAIYWGYGRRLIINVPNPDGSFGQHVYNTGLDAWCSYSNLMAYCWCVWGDKLYFGSRNGFVQQFGVLGGDDTQSYPPWNTTAWDSVPWQEVSFQPITARAQQAWNLFGTPQQKRVAALRPVMRSAQQVQYAFGLGYDYGDPVLNITPPEHLGTRTPWNITPWGSPWERDANTDAIWYICQGDGSAISVALNVTTDTNQPLIWIRTDLRIEPGQAL